MHTIAGIPCRATRVAADFLDFIAFCRCSTGVALHALKILVSHLPPLWPGGVAPKFGSEKVSRYTGVSQLQLRVSRYTVQLRLKLGGEDSTPKLKRRLSETRYVPENLREASTLIFEIQSCTVRSDLKKQQKIVLASLKPLDWQCLCAAIYRSLQALPPARHPRNVSKKSPQRSQPGVSNKSRKESRSLRQE